MILSPAFPKYAVFVHGEWAVETEMTDGSHVVEIILPMSRFDPCV